MKTAQMMALAICFTFVFACGKKVDAIGPVMDDQPQVEQNYADIGVTQVAIFFALDNEQGLQDLVNRWLSQNQDVEIVQILQSQNGADGRYYRHVVISIFYKKTM